MARTTSKDARPRVDCSSGVKASLRSVREALVQDRFRNTRVFIGPI